MNSFTLSWKFWENSPSVHVDQVFIDELQSWTPKKQNLELELRNCKIFDQQTLEFAPHLCQTGECKHFRDHYYLCECTNGWKGEFCTQSDYHSVLTSPFGKNYSVLKKDKFF